MPEGIISFEPTINSLSLIHIYYRSVAGLKALDEVSAEIDSAIFGTIFHRSAELVYNELTTNGREIRKEDLEQLLKDDVRLQDYVDNAFKEKFFNVPLTEQPEYNGTQLIHSKVIASYPVSYTHLSEKFTSSTPRPYVEQESTSTMAADPIGQDMSRKQLEKSIERTKKLMQEAAKKLDFIEAAQYRDCLLYTSQGYKCVFLCNPSG